MDYYHALCHYKYHVTLHYRIWVQRFGISLWCYRFNFQSIYRQTYNTSSTKSQTYIFFVSSNSWLCPIHWSQVLNREWRCSCSSADRRCSKYICVINNLIGYKGAAILAVRRDALWGMINHIKYYSKHTLWTVISSAKCSFPFGLHLHSTSWNNLKPYKRILYINLWWIAKGLFCAF